MTAEQLVRDQLDRATRDVAGGPDLAASIRLGRRQRLRRRAGLALAAVAVVGAGAVGVGTALSGDSPTTARDNPATDAGVADAPRAEDYVPGTDIDERMAATVAAHLPELPAADDVYPSDADHRGPMPDAEFAQATDWQAAYTTPSSQVLVIMALAEEVTQPFACDGCTATRAPGGTLYRQKFTSGDEQWFGVYFARDDGSMVNAFEHVPLGNAADRVFTDRQFEALVQDPALTFG